MIEDLLIHGLKKNLRREAEVAPQALSAPQMPRYKRLGRTIEAEFIAPDLMGPPPPSRPALPEELPEPLLGADGTPTEAPPELLEPAPEPDAFDMYAQNTPN